ncbi:Wall-associated kinase family protein [Rhynchospora pubera]|uniref:Wall-associated kinase family protein n=1 Tax=Rhynchospora pubera TaxID=906938 RepID=A0AAV8D1T0_9POAL|nr:Wall-associated kinase family protein [Rhynchospora pubera]
MGAMMLIIIQVLLLISPSITKSSAQSDVITLPGCPESCGGVTIPYPFGIGSKCAMPGFELNCSATNAGTSTPYLGNYTLLNISLSSGLARVNMPVSYQCYGNTTRTNLSSTYTVDWSGTPFQLNTEKNIIRAIGCNTLASLTIADSGNSYVGVTGCAPLCESLESLTNGNCSGIGCCQATIPETSNYFLTSFSDLDADLNTSISYNFTRCGYAMLMENSDFYFKTSYITTNELIGQNTSAVIDWSIGNTTCNIAQGNKSTYACRSGNSLCLNSSTSHGYLCNCSDGYQGNPYLEGGCQDINECLKNNPCSAPAKCHNSEGGYKCSCPFGRRLNHDNKNECELNLALVLGACAGVIVLCFLVLGAYALNEKRKLSKVEEKYFQEHGGRILLEKIQSDQGFGFAIFTKQQIEQATNNFDNANIIGHGGQGTVYKGSLRGQMVAIKKCKITDERKKKEFGKEMLILSQINHKNIVKILGCCLEVEVPMLVYEFIPNGTLFHHIHSNNRDNHISLSIRLRIAHESAEALSYLHFSASPPIFHGDVKSLNILLDENYTAKVSDFGASILSPTDEAQFVTFVQGTCGYLDPEYMQSCQLTDKSDVYSFGVVLLELLICKPVFNFDAPEDERSLSSCFLSAMKENKLHELLNDEIKSKDDIEVIMEVARLAKECLNMKGEDRPTMKEVAEELDRIRKLTQHPWSQGFHPEETETLLNEASHSIEIDHTDYFSLEKKAKQNIAAGR